MKTELEQLIHDELALKSRRKFLLGAAGGGAMATLGGFGFTMKAMAAAANASTTPPEDYRALVCFFLFGGNDTANTLIPYDQATYDSYVIGREGSLARPFGITRLRTDLLPLAASSVAGKTLALPKEMGSLKRLYDRGKAGVITNVGVLAAPTTKVQYNAKTVELPPQLFSHSDHQRFWQLGVPNYSTRTGWAGRMGDLMASMNGGSKVSMCVSMAGNNSWQVGNTVLPYPINSETGAPEFWSWWNTQRKNGMNALNAQARTNLLERQAARVYTRTIDAQAVMNASLGPDNDMEGLFSYVPPDLAPGMVDEYMNVMEQFRMTARMIAARKKFGHKRQTFFISLGGFDNHDSLADHPDRLRVVADGMAAFYRATELLDVDQYVTTFTASDFGRTLKSNGTGADHAWGAHHFVMGGSVRGGNVYGTFPNLSLTGPDTVESQGQLLPTTSVDQYAATMARWFGVPDTDMATVMPNVSRFATSDLGFMTHVRGAPPRRQATPVTEPMT
jgi:uncharacterized protein (DUF1501 family)